jgi:hypothetical protein
MKKQSLSYIILTILALCNAALGASDTTNFPLPYSNPAFACSSFCKYLTDGTGKLVSMCNAGGAGVNGQCTDCDELLFRLIPGTNNCIAHNYNGEYLEGE